FFKNLTGHIIAGAKKVIMASPSKDVPLVILGVNEENIDEGENIISAGSSTINAFGPIAKILNDTFKIQTAMICSIHSISGQQNTIDGSMKGSNYRFSR